MLTPQRRALDVPVNFPLQSSANKKRTQVTVSNPRPDNTVALDSHALGTLNYIRASIEAAGAFAVPGIAGIAMGIVGLSATLVASLPGLSNYWLEIWLVAAIAASAIGVALVARQQARGFILYRGPARKFVLSLCPALLAGVVLTTVFWQAGLTSFVPGMWLLLYGCAVLSASLMTSANMVRLIALMGALFVVYGMIAFQLPVRWHNYTLGLGFGVLHLLFGVLIARADHAG
jgi:hypothetical protein